MPGLDLMADAVGDGVADHLLEAVGVDVARRGPQPNTTSTTSCGRGRLPTWVVRIRVPSLISSLLPP